MKGGVFISNIYNNTKEKELVSYELFIETSLDKLGFRKNTLGTKYLKDLILFTFNQKIYNIFINRISTEFLKEKKIEYISEKKFLDNINYAIKNVDYQKFKNNFNIVFKAEYDIYYLSTKNIVILFLNILERI